MSVVFPLSVMEPFFTLEEEEQWRKDYPLFADPFLSDASAPVPRKNAEKISLQSLVFAEFRIKYQFLAQSIHSFFLQYLL